MSDTGRYILDAKHRAIPCPDLMEWAAWFENDRHRRVDLTNLANGHRVSTVFLGLCHRFGDGGPPLLFETMIFPGNDQWRYSTWEEAKAGHAEACLKAAELPAIEPETA